MDKLLYAIGMAFSSGDKYLIGSVIIIFPAILVDIVLAYILNENTVA